MAQLKSTNINGDLNVYGVSTTKKMVVDNNSGSSNIEIINTVQSSNERVYIKMKPLAAYNNSWSILADNANNFKLYYNNGSSDSLKFRIDSNGNLFAVDGGRKVWTEANINPMPKNGGTFTGNIDFYGSANIVASNGNTNGYYAKKTDGVKALLLNINSSNECLVGNDTIKTKLCGTTLQYHGYDVWHKGIFNPTRNIDANTLNGNTTFRCKNNYGVYYLKNDGTETEGWYVTPGNIFYKNGDITVSGTINSEYGDIRNNITSLNTLHNSVNTIKNDSYKLHNKEIGNSSSYSNLNSVYIPGNYRSPLAHYLWSNLPSGVTGAFELCVNSIQGESTMYTTQYLKDYRNNNLYVRTRTDSSWNSWKKFWIEGDILLSAGYNNDLAENFETLDTTIEPGDIVALDCNSNEETYVKATENSEVVVGVCSDTYGFLLGGIKEEDDKKYTPIGLCGRVYVKFTGNANTGDKVVPSNIPGIGRAFRDGDSLDKVIGVLTESDDKTTVRRLRMLIK